MHFLQQFQLVKGDLRALALPNSTIISNFHWSLLIWVVAIIIKDFLTKNIPWEFSNSYVLRLEKNKTYLKYVDLK